MITLTYVVKDNFCPCFIVLFFVLICIIKMQYFKFVHEKEKYAENPIMYTKNFKISAP